METVFVCGVCGKKTTDLDGWVFGQKYCAPAGEMIIRCPEHIIDEDGEDARDHAHVRVATVPTSTDPDPALLISSENLP